MHVVRVRSRHTVASGETHEYVSSLLRRSFRRFVFPLTALFLAWYFLFVLLSVFAKDFMGTRLFGNITWGLTLGLLQFVSTFAITMYYARWADRVFDPEADQLQRVTDLLAGMTDRYCIAHFTDLYVPERSRL